MIAALASVVYVPAAAAMALNALSARRFGVRIWHAAAPTALTGAAFMLVPLGVRRGGPFAGIALIVVAAMGAWAVSGAPPVPPSAQERCVHGVATMSKTEGWGLLRAFSVMSVTVRVGTNQSSTQKQVGGCAGCGSCQ